MSVPQNINPPMFASANNHPGSDPPAWLMEGNDPLDVDLLAEYLLDDGKPAPNGMTFDFNIDASAGNNSGVVSPEQSEDGGFPPMAEANNMHHSMAPQPIAPAPSPHPQQAHAPVPYHQTHQYLVPTMGPGVPVAPPPMAYSYAPAPPHALAPAPPINGAQNMVSHQQHGIAKRQRVDTVPVPSAPTTSSIVPGGQQLVDAAQAAAMAGGGRGRKKSQVQIDRRRERNRILARRTRLRKKFFFESLQKEVMDLQRQNAALKDLVKSKFPMEESRKVLETCKAAEKLPEAVVEACSELSAEMEQQDFNLVRSVQQSQHSFIITDPCLQDNPIVFASDGFLKITGYSREGVLGQNCRFLQGADTSKAKLDTIRRGLSAAEDVTVTLVNYTADGTPFWNKLFIAALRDSSNNIVNFIGVVVKVLSPPQGDPEFGKVLIAEDETNTEAAMDADGTIKAVEGVVTSAVHMP